MHSAFVTKYYLSLFLKLKFITFVKKIQGYFLDFFHEKNIFQKLEFRKKMQKVNTKLIHSLYFPAPFSQYYRGQTPFEVAL